MDINIDPEKPWLEQLKQLKLDLVHKALLDCKGSRTEAGKLLGIDARHIRYILEKNPEIYVDPPEPVKKALSEAQNGQISALFELTYTCSEIAQLMAINASTVRKKLEKKYGDKGFSKIHDKNKIMKKRRQKSMENTENILERHRQLVHIILDSFHKREFDKLDKEQLYYAKLMLQNGFVNEKGHITEKGKEALLC